MQKCESVAELNECKKWIAQFISAAPDMTPDCRRSVRMFFQRKYALRAQWVLAFRLKRRSYNVAASCRVEGEFGVVNKLNISGAMNFRTGIRKIRCSASNRHLKKIHRAERWSATKVIRDSSCPISVTDFKVLDEQLTPFYRNFIEQQVLAAETYLKAQLIEIIGDNEMIFRVWSPTAHGDENISGSDESSSNSDDDEMQQLPVPQTLAAYPENESHPDFADPQEQTSEPGPYGVTDNSSASEAFNWLRVRTVQATYSKENKEWVLKCSCGCLERTCAICRHTFCVIKLMLQNYGVKYLRFNRRCYKGFYHNVMCTADDFDVAQGDTDVHPAIPKKLVDLWLSTSPVASNEDVPQEGIFGKDCDFGEEAADASNDGGNGGTLTNRRGDNPKRRAANAASLNQQVYSIIDLLGPVSGNVTGYNHFSDYLQSYSDTLGRAPRVAAPGRGKQNRTVGVSDVGSGSYPVHARKHNALPGASQSKQKATATPSDDHPALRAPCQSESAATALRTAIRIAGVKDGNFVEVYPIKSAPTTDRWFLKVVDGSVVGISKKLSLAACLWCRTNTLQLDPFQKEVARIEIQSIFDEGPAAKFQNLGTHGRVPPKVVKVANIAQDTRPSTRIVPGIGAGVGVTLPAATVPVFSATSATTDCDNDYFLNKMKESVKPVSYFELLQEMKSKGLVGVDQCKGKEDLIRLMVEQKIAYTVAVQISSDGNDIETPFGSGAAVAAPPKKKTPRPNPLPPQSSQQNVHFEWVKGTIGWLAPGSATEVVPGTAVWALRTKAKCVSLVEFAVLQEAMKRALVPGSAEAKTKDSLIEIMCSYNCDFVALPHPLIKLGVGLRSIGQQVYPQEYQYQAAAAAPPTAPPTTAPTPDAAIADESSSDSEAPISRAAIKLALAARDRDLQAAALKRPQRAIASKHHLK